VTRPGAVAGAASGAAAVAALVLAGVDAASTLAGLGGAVVLVAAGLLAGRRGAVTAGAGGLGVAVTAAGLAGASAPALAAGAAAAVLAWTTGQASVELRRRRERDVATTRLELAHVAGTTGLVGAAAVLAVAPRALSFRPSPLGVALVLFGGVALAAAVLLGD